jgi:ABC-type multidrug transport system ATPase subunit
LSSLDKIIVEEIHKSFGPIKVLEGISMYIKKGEKVGIIGPNGAGKTTLLRIMLGILKPDKGYVSGIEYSPKFFGYVPQAVLSYPMHRSIDVVHTALKLANYPSKNLKKIAEELCKKYNIDPMSTGRELSAGQARFLIFVMAISKNPDLLILDEPTAMMDVSRKKVIWGAIVNYDKTVIMVTHDVDELRLVDRIFFLNKGKIVFEGSFKDFSRFIRAEGYVVEVKSGKETKRIKIQNLNDLNNLELNDKDVDEIIVRKITPEDIASLMQKEVSK